MVRTVYHTGELMEVGGSDDETVAAGALLSLPEVPTEEDKLMFCILKDVPKRAKLPCGTLEEKKQCQLVASSICAQALQLATLPGVSSMSSDQARVDIAWTIWKEQHMPKQSHLWSRRF
jgi:hypothetical protein